MQRNISDADPDSEHNTIVVRPGMNAFERQQVFREMVVQQLRNGPLSRLRRRRIVQFAAKLGITAVLAGRLVQQAQRDQPPSRGLQSAPTSPQIRSRRSRAVLPLAIGLVLINAWLILQLFN